MATDVLVHPDQRRMLMVAAESQRLKHEGRDIEITLRAAIGDLLDLHESFAGGAPRAVRLSLLAEHPCEVGPGAVGRLSRRGDDGARPGRRLLCAGRLGRSPEQDKSRQRQENSRQAACKPGVGRSLSVEIVRMSGRTPALAQTAAPIQETTAPATTHGFNFRLRRMWGGGRRQYYFDRRNLHRPDGLSGTRMRPYQPLP